MPVSPIAPNLPPKLPENTSLTPSAPPKFEDPNAGFFAKLDPKTVKAFWMGLENMASQSIQSSMRRLKEAMKKMGKDDQ